MTYARHIVTRSWRDRLIIIAPFVGIAVLALIAPSDDGPTICPFALCTGTACPGCGLTRAAAHLLRGDWATALSYHPLVPLIGAQLIAGWIWFTLSKARRVAPMSQRLLRFSMVTTTLALALVWGLRLATGTLPPV